MIIVNEAGVLDYYKEKYNQELKRRREREILIMNKKQLVVMWCSIVAIVLMGVFPPVEIPTSTNIINPSYDLHYGFLLTIRAPVYLSCLIAQWMICLALVGGMLYVFKDKNTKLLEWRGLKKMVIMNRKQKYCLFIGILLIVQMGLYPPSGSPIYTMRYHHIDYHFILSEYVVVLSNLIVQWVIVSAITGGLIVTFKDKKPKDE